MHRHYRAHVRLSVLYDYSDNSLGLVVRVLTNPIFFPELKRISYDSFISPSIHIRAGVVLVIKHKLNAVALLVDHDHDHDPVANVNILLGIVLYAVVTIVFCTVSKFFLETFLELVFWSLFWTIIIFGANSDILFCESIKNFILPVVIFFCQHL
ncbi:hypothetical protein KCU67_g10682, partial [Aureobasidium melanogenum]